jgi:hypothetical protein
MIMIITTKTTKIRIAQKAIKNNVKPPNEDIAVYLPK